MHLVRHNRLVAPYHDYTQLTVSQMDALATGTVSPDIQPLPDVLPFDAEVLKEASFFVCSTSARAQQTCAALRARFGLTQDMHIDGNLGEIGFLPSLMQVAAGDNVLDTVRKRLYASILDGAPGVEHIDHLRTRIDKLEADYKGQGCVLFTHGFLMRLLQSRAQQGGSLENGLRTIGHVPPVDYLSLISL